MPLRMLIFAVLVAVVAADPFPVGADVGTVSGYFILCGTWRTLPLAHSCGRFLIAYIFRLAVDRSEDCRWADHWSDDLKGRFMHVHVLAAGPMARPYNGVQVLSLCVPWLQVLP